MNLYCFADENMWGHLIGAQSQGTQYPWRRTGTWATVTRSARNPPPGCAPTLTTFPNTRNGCVIHLPKFVSSSGTFSDKKVNVDDIVASGERLNGNEVVTSGEKVKCDEIMLFGEKVNSGNNIMGTNSPTSLSMATAAIVYLAFSGEK
ncbi:hypothetical protein GUJ93_ZPchr0004g39987 [Zizania palustris]|uniref:Uncharacterized protein n=1 Tax=Zizania palustris TaxID=103762 RepID=A0A8J5VG43_ZIZPA|nr:hypothetical protein GUJ93_ZPchr0004g39987 [Zizania palustris]